MPRFQRELHMGTPMHAIEYGAPRDPRMSCRLGRVVKTIEITDEEAQLGIDALVRKYFPEPMREATYYGA
jgi:hypothetical protein